MLHVNLDSLVIVCYFSTKTFPNKKTAMSEMIENIRIIYSELNSTTTHFNRRICSRYLEQPLLFRSLLQKSTCVYLNIWTRCLHTDDACYIFVQIFDTIQCFVHWHRSQYGIMKYHTRLLKKTMAAHPSSSVGTVVNWSLHSSRVLWWPDIPLVRELLMWNAGVDKHIPIDSRVVKCVSG